MPTPLSRSAAPSRAGAGRAAGRARATANPALVTVLAAIMCGTLACSVGDPAAPADVQDRNPDIVKTPEGARTYYLGVRAMFEAAVSEYVYTSGTLTDESTLESDLDRRAIPLGSINTGAAYALLHSVRTNAQQARGVLAEYAPGLPKALTGELYAMEAMADVLLADLYCSGIPLSTLDYGGDYTLQPGSSTAEVYAAAIALFDSALARSADSARIRDFARLGQARALLALSRDSAQAAARVVASVPMAFVYRPSEYRGGEATAPWGGGLLSDQEGTNGLPFVSSHDPRSATAPRTWPNSTTLSVALASGVEARLIEAEAALRAGDTTRWLGTLNTLRTDGTFDVSGPDGTDTTWHAGTGGVAGLRPLTDPGSDTARVSLLFAERGYWLYLSGHRQGDLRRLVRDTTHGGYGRPQDHVYPTGLYLGTSGGGGLYSTDVTLPVPPAEQASNPRYHGCLDRRA